jgi:hypothetical protein
MRIGKEMEKKLAPDELFTLKSENRTVYDALLYVCMNRGYADIVRFAKRMTKESDNRKIMVLSSLNEADNAKLAKYMVRIGLHTASAIDMFELFFLCDTADSEGIKE